VVRAMGRKRRWPRDPRSFPSRDVAAEVWRAARTDATLDHVVWSSTYPLCGDIAQQAVNRPVHSPLLEASWGTLRWGKGKFRW